MSEGLKCEARVSMLEVRIMRPWSGEAERRGMRAWERK